MHAKYTNNQTRAMLEEFWEKNYQPKYTVLAKEMGVTYTYLMDFKNGGRDLGAETLNKIINFIEENNK